MGIWSTTYTHIRRSPYQAIAAILVMFLTFLLTGLFFLTTVASQVILRHFESKPQLVVFFKDKVEFSKVESLIRNLEQTGKTSSITYVSQEDALAIYRELNKNDPLLLEMVTADILPSSLEVSAIDPSYLKDLEEAVRKSEDVEEVVYQRDVVESLLSWTRVIRITGVTLVGFLVLVSFLTIMTIVNLKIALRKDEIEIFQLVGASPWYIRAPFLLEGGIYGMVGSVLAFIVIFILILWLRPFLLSFLGNVTDIQMVLSDIRSSLFILCSLLLFSGLLITGVLLGSLGSFVSLGRFLKSSR